MIAAGNSRSAFAAKAATTTIPIVFSVNEDPVRLGLVASFAWPGGNLTGVNIFTSELAAKRLELLRELVPTATRVAVLVNPENAANTETTLRDVATAARALGLQIQIGPPTPAARSTRPSQHLRASDPTPSSSRAMASHQPACPVGQSGVVPSRSLRHLRPVKLPKPTG